MTKPRKGFSAEVRNLSMSEILKNYEYFEGLSTQIFDLFAHTNFCKQTRLFSNVIFMLLKDLMEIYRIYYTHITEILERFPSLSKNEAQKAFVMYQNFINLTDAIKNKANKLIYIFNFPITLPDFYNPERGLIDTLLGQQVADPILDLGQLPFQQPRLHIGQHLAGRQQRLQFLGAEPDPRQFEMPGQRAIVVEAAAVGIGLDGCAQVIPKVGDQPVQGGLGTADLLHQCLAADGRAPLVQDVVQVVEAFQLAHAVDCGIRRHDCNGWRGEG